MGDPGLGTKAGTTIRAATSNHMSPMLAIHVARRGCVRDAIDGASTMVPCDRTALSDTARP